MKRSLVILLALFSLSAHQTYAEDLVEPEIVRLESISINGNTKTIHVGNAKGHYTLNCTIGAESASDPKYKDTLITMCTSPKSDLDYWVYDNKTKWNIPGAKETSTLQFFEDFSVAYKGENIALVPTDNKSDWGIYSLKSWTK